MKNRYYRLSAILLVCILSAPILTVLRYEKQASKNMAVNVSKRAVAEAGAIVSGNTVVSRYIMKLKDGNEIPFGPEKTAHPANTKSIDEYVKKYLEGAKITDIHNYNISEYAGAFQYEELMTPQLKVLSQTHGLDKLASQGDSEIEKLIILRDWVKRAIPRGNPKDVDYNFNAIDILTRAGKGEAFFCSEYSTVFVQCALSLGFQARYIGLFKGHAVAEVWSNQFVKWMVMDVDNDLHYEREGIPLNALELHQAWEERVLEDVKALRGLKRIDTSAEEKEYLASYYHEFFIRMRNDWFSHKYPHWHKNGNSIMNSLEWQDRFTGDNILVSRATRNQEELYFPINAVSLMVDPVSSSKGSNLHLILDTFTPNFSHFLVQVDGGESTVTARSTYDWHLHSGTNMINIKAVNILGVEGPESTAKITLQGDAG